MDVFYGDLEVVEGPSFCYLDFFHEPGSKVLKDKAIRGDKEGEGSSVLRVLWEVDFFGREGVFGLLVHFPNLGAPDWEHAEAVGIWGEEGFFRNRRHCELKSEKNWSYASFYFGGLWDGFLCCRLKIAWMKRNQRNWRNGSSDFKGFGDGFLCWRLKRVWIWVCQGEWKEIGGVKMVLIEREMDMQRKWGFWEVLKGKSAEEGMVWIEFYKDEEVRERGLFEFYETFEKGEWFGASVVISKTRLDFKDDLMVTWVRIWKEIVGSWDCDWPTDD